MRAVTLVLLLAGLLLWPVLPAAASPRGPSAADPPQPSRCEVDDAGELTACPRRFRLSGGISGRDLLLRWEGSKAAAFDIYYSSAPFAGYVRIDESELNSYRETLAHIDNVAINDYYQVREKGTGELSNRLGVFTFPLG